MSINRVLLTIKQLDPAQRRRLFILISILLVIVLLSTFAGFLIPIDPLHVEITRTYESPSLGHFFGTDNLGRDVFTRVVHGARISLGIASLSVLTMVGVAIPLGLLAGYRGLGWLDKTLTLIMDSFYVFPGLILAILLAFLLGPTTGSIALAIAFPNVPGFFRVIRNATLSLKERLFIEATKAIGASDLYVVFRGVLPQIAPMIATLAVLTLGNTILTIASLGFLGLGVQPPIPEWGTDLAISREFVSRGAWWMTLFPGLAIVGITFLFLTLGDTLNDILNPRARSR